MRRHLHILFLLLGLFIRLHNSSPTPQTGEDVGSSSFKATTAPSPLQSMYQQHSSNMTCAQDIPATVSASSSHRNGGYPADLFSLKERRQGWVVLHMIGIVYTFVSLAVVSNEFFVPALWGIIDKFDISHDVAGATVMAAARSIPKLVITIIGDFFSYSIVGMGNIVGWAIFNFLFVVGLCALFSLEVLHLTKWPFCRDVAFYILDLVLLTTFFLDNVIRWWESMTLVASYIFYLVIMKFNVHIKLAFQTHLLKKRDTFEAISSEEPKESRAKDKSLDEEKNDPLKPLEEPLSIEWPHTCCKQVTSLLLVPIFPLLLTVPDIYKKNSRKFFLVTLLSSILWISVFSYLMVWWAHLVGETFSIPGEIIGLTVLAAGTSIPDIMTSVVVAREGFGDMAVSSCLGNNIFNVTICLPAKWLLYSLSHGLMVLPVSTDGLLCAIVLLFLTLLFFIISIVSCKWKLCKTLGFMMLLLYGFFIMVSVMLRYHIVVCPL
ncbi:sodium/potassium/calcium exchanger 1-like isoform X1 [Entelurus aequoreus]|uniref:sodium/potassium/calcium exchanger 1-like isoform X1 n=1 Tax=Entelurus aequoreus TaxID=161455 RepID=UPI002B1E09C0|nr:sodium/potassium/calcium exchanger 1-like isoform X1 [Entelurus aequoreus]XP_061917106.1 sodium/potassium/calcium exchanger 1-like isoform X1 [Entelurus aequoreus]